MAPSVQTAVAGVASQASPVEQSVLGKGSLRDRRLGEMGIWKFSISSVNKSKARSDGYCETKVKLKKKKSSCEKQVSRYMKPSGALAHW